MRNYTKYIMKLLFAVGLVLLLTQLGYGQKLKFQEKTRVAIASKADKDFPVIRLSSSYNTTITNVVFNTQGDTISYQKDSTKIWNRKDTLDSALAGNNGIEKKDYMLFAEIKPEGKFLRLYFYPFKDTSDTAKKIANIFFLENDFAIELEPRQNLAFGYRRFHAGAMTLPLKIYVGSRASENVNNIGTNTNVGLYFGGLFGKKRYLKLPSGAEYWVYDYGWSINAFAGLSKLDITDSTTLDANSFTGSVVSSSLGVSFGWHYRIFSIFAATGFDIPLSSKADNWVFKGQPWIGFGAGFGIF